MSLFALPPIQARLKAKAPILRDVGFAADLAAATAPGAVLAGPQAFVMVMGMDAYEAKEFSGPLRQGLAVNFAVLIGVTLAGQRGEAGLRALDEPVTQARAAIFGWHHPDGEIACRLTAEGVEDFDSKTGVLLYRLDFTTDVVIQETFD
ncbi:hypothetical protein [Phenylobacterium sp. 58.2.17]|uniref:phage tail terminator protein n=1 Tax=Phenylobacterium sp. 58.2.17 TaxID=2969306 RepID=UPI002263F39B|nr:hypothetical protein [Phenylobacterium sp. 58.2.17]MCX7586542.1 hypothetical protein [Phenylobacterium sp. 58.2.17]